MKKDVKTEDFPENRFYPILWIQCYSRELGHEESRAKSRVVHRHVRRCVVPQVGRKVHPQRLWCFTLTGRVLSIVKKARDFQITSLQGHEGKCIT